MLAKELKPSLMFSQYEIANIKSVWLSLNLCSNFNDPNISTKNSIPMFIYDTINMERFENELGLTIFKTDMDSLVTTSSSIKYKYNILDKYSLLLSQENFDVLRNDYQINSIINLITVMIYHLEYGKSVPQDYIMQILKINSRLYSLNCRNYTIFGNSLIKTIAFCSSRFNGDKRQIFSKFISKLLTTLVYYSHDSGIVNLSQTHENTKSVLSNDANNNNNSNSIIQIHDNQIHPTLTNGSTTTTSYSPPRKSSTMSIFSQPSQYTEQSSLLSLHLADNISESSADLLSEDIMTMTTKPQPSEINKNVVEEHAKENLREKELELIQELEAEEATITPSYDEALPDDSYDYLNSFGLSEVDQSPIREQEMNTDFDDLKSLQSNASNMSSFKKWGGKFKKNKNEKKFLSKNLVRTNSTVSYSSSRRSIAGQDDGCVVM